MPRFPFFLVEWLKRAVDHSHKVKLLNIDRVQFDSNAFCPTSKRGFIAHRAHMRLQ